MLLYYLHLSYIKLMRNTRISCSLVILTDLLQPVDETVTQAQSRYPHHKTHHFSDKTSLMNQSQRPDNDKYENSSSRTQDTKPKSMEVKILRDYIENVLLHRRRRLIGRVGQSLADNQPLTAFHAMCLNYFGF